MKIRRPWKEVIDEWTPELAKKLGRPESEIRSKGLSASDFSGRNFVEVRYPYGLTYRISLAFAVIRPGQRQAAVFSEHAGYMEFDLIEDCEIGEFQEDFYRPESE